MINILTRLCFLFGLIMASSVDAVPAIIERNQSYTIYFSENSTKIASQQEKFELIVCDSKQLEISSINVIAYADASEKKIEQLSEERIKTVIKQLSVLNVSSDKIYSNIKKIKEINYPDEPYLNRRVEIKINGIPSQRGTFNKCTQSIAETLKLDSVDKTFSLLKARVREDYIPAHEPIIAAIKAKRFDLLDLLLNESQEIPLDSDSRQIIMKEAILTGDLAIIERLISFGIRIDEFKNQSLPVIWVTCSHYPNKIPEQIQPKLVEQLLAWGARIDGFMREYNWEHSALECAAAEGQLTLVDFLLRNGALPNLPTSNPPIVAGGNYPEIVKRLVQAGANMRVKTTRTGTNLFHSFHFNSPEEVRHLADQDVGINARDESNYTPIYIAARYANLKILQEFLDNGALINPPGLNGNVLSAVMHHNNIPALVWLMDKNAPVYADRNFYYYLINKNGDEALPVFQAMQRRNINLNERLYNNESPLLYAIWSFAPELVEFLVSIESIRTPEVLAEALGKAERLEGIYIPRQNTDGAAFTKEQIAEKERLNSKEMIAERLQKKEKIIRIIETALEKLH